MIKKIETINFQTKFGQFLNTVYEINSNKEPYTQFGLAIYTKVALKQAVPLVRIHSSCIFSEVFGSLVCDCSSQLSKTLKMFNKEGGIFIYLDQEGRSHGLFNKVKELKLQEQGLDTIEASRALHLKVDSRIYDSAALILQDLGVTSLILLTNNPQKVSSIEKLGIKVKDRVPIEVRGNNFNYKYLKTKKDKMGHFLKLY